MIYELWDIETANLVESFTTEAEALEAVRKAVDDLGRKIVRCWALISKDLGSGRTATVARGARLIDRAFLTPAWISGSPTTASPHKDVQQDEK